mgnify:CR=1 FL=1
MRDTWAKVHNSYNHCSVVHLFLLITLWLQMKSNHLFERLSTRTPINKTVYEALHKGKRKRSVVKPNGEFALVGIGREGQLEGQRNYEWIE